MGSAYNRNSDGDIVDMVPCTTCDGQRQVLMRGAAHRGYDDPDYWDTCGICGGTGELPASMFTATEDDADGYDDSLAWSV